MRSRLWLVVALVVTLVLLPDSAYAEEAHKQESLRELERIELEETELRAVNNPISNIRSFFNRMNVYYHNGSFEAVYPLRQWPLFIVRTFTEFGTKGAYLAAIALVFLWWGVRMVIRMLFRAFRRGKANV